MALCTAYGNKPWGATVFYAFNKKIELHFFSRPDTRHSLDIAENSNVAVVINHDWHDKNGRIRGVQISGRAAKVTKKGYASSFSLFKKRFSWAEKFAHDHILYKITPKEIWLIDEAFFGDFFRRRIR